jgi:hypothetical protein
MCSGVLVTVKMLEHHQLSRTWPGPRVGSETSSGIVDVRTREACQQLATLTHPPHGNSGQCSSHNTRGTHERHHCLTEFVRPLSSLTHLLKACLHVLAACWSRHSNSRSTQRRRDASPRSQPDDCLHDTAPLSVPTSLSTKSGPGAQKSHPTCPV